MARESQGDLVVAAGLFSSDGEAEKALADPLTFADAAARDVLPFFASGLDAEAFEHLFAARRQLVLRAHREAALRVDFALIGGAIETGDGPSAVSWMKGASRACAEIGTLLLRAHAHVAQVLAWRAGFSDRPIAVFAEAAGLGESLQREVAFADALVISADDPHRGFVLLQELVERESSALMQARTFLEMARIGGLVGGRESGLFLRNAIELAVAHGFRRLEGRARLQLAWIHLTGDESEEALRETAAAHTALGTVGTAGDRILLGRIFRRTGRRFADRALGDGSVRALENAQQVQSSVQGTLMAMRAISERAIAGVVRSSTLVGADQSALRNIAGAAHEELRRVHRGRGTEAIDEMHRAVQELVVELSKVEEQAAKLRLLLERIPRLEQTAGTEHATDALCALGLEILDADLAVVVIEHGDTYEVLAQKSRSGQTSERWRPHVGAELASPGTVRRPSSAPRGDTSIGGHLVVPIYAGEHMGSFYADRETRGGSFVELDERLGTLLGDYISLVLSRSSAHKAERRLHRQLEATFDAIRQGILSVGGDGGILAANADALRILRLPARDVIGRKLSQFHDLRDLEAALPVSRRLDGVVVKIGSVNAVVTARPFDDASSSGGLLLSFVEFERAQSLARRVTAIRPRYTFDDCVGESAKMRAAVGLGRQAALVDATVLITGESGTGKEVLAQAIHSASVHSAAPFVGINCAALPRELLEAELFGYEKGAFTGAKVDGNAGKFELAGDGTILLDEIGDMPLDMQAKLLRVLQERSVQRLGGNRERPVNARVIATTHQNLESLVSEGKFRLDLLFRLRVLAIELPAMRDRPTDIVPLCMHYLQRFGERQGKRVHGIAPGLETELVAYEWPGNIREIANVMESEVSRLSPDVPLLSALTSRLIGNSPISTFLQSQRGPVATVWHTPPPPSVHGIPGPPGGPGLGSVGHVDLVTPGVIELLSVVERRAFMQAYDLMDGNVGKAAQALGVSKVTFYAKLKQWGIHVAIRARGSTEDSIEREVQRRVAEQMRLLEGGEAPPTPRLPR